MKNAFDMVENEPVKKKSAFDVAETDDKQFSSAFDVIESEKPNNFIRGVKSATDSMQGSLYGAAGLAGDALGIDKVRDWGFEGFKRNEEEAKQNAVDVQNFTDIKSLSDAGKWAAGGLGQLVPSVVEAGVTAGIGAGIGAAAGGGVASPVTAPTGAVAGLFGRQAVKGLLKNQIEKRVATEAGQAVLAKSGREAAEAAALRSIGRSVGAKAGIVAGVAPLEAGGMYGEDASKHGIENANPWSAGGLSLLSGATELVSPGGRLISGIAGGTGRKFLEEIGKTAGDKLWKRLAIEIPKSMGGEFAQEATQEFIGKVNEKINDTTGEVSLTDKQALVDYLNAGAVGALGGVAFGGVSALHAPQIDTTTGKIIPQAQPASTPATKAETAQPLPRTFANQDFLANQQQPFTISQEEAEAMQAGRMQDPIRATLIPREDVVGIIEPTTGDFAPEFQQSGLPTINERQQFTQPFDQNFAPSPEFVPQDDAEAMQFGRESQQTAKDDQQIAPFPPAPPPGFIDYSDNAATRQTQPAPEPKQQQTPLTPTLAETHPEQADFGKGKTLNRTSYQEENGVGYSEYTNPETGLVDTYLAGFGDNDFVGYMRVYENGKPTNRFTSKLEVQSGKKGAAKEMLAKLGSMLPADHEYTENDTISTDGIRHFQNQLRNGYEIVRDESGNVKTSKAYLSGASKTNDIGIGQTGDFTNLQVNSEQDFQKAKGVVSQLLSPFGIGEEGVRRVGSQIEVDMPVLRRISSDKSIAPAQEQRQDTISIAPLTEQQEKAQGIKHGSNEIAAAAALGTRDQVAEYIKTGKTDRLTFRKKDAIDAAVSNPNYNVRENEDGSVTVIGIKNSSDEWVGISPEESAKRVSAEDEAATKRGQSKVDTFFTGLLQNLDQAKHDGAARVRTSGPPMDTRRDGDVDRPKTTSEGDKQNIDDTGTNRPSISTNAGNAVVSSIPLGGQDGEVGQTQGQTTEQITPTISSTPENSKVAEQQKTDKSQDKFSPKQAIKLVADDIEQLRPQDVYRVLESVDGENRETLRKFIIKNQASNQRILDEVRSAIEDLRAEEGANKVTETVTKQAPSNKNDTPREQADGLTSAVEFDILKEGGTIYEIPKDETNAALESGWGSAGVPEPTQTTIFGESGKEKPEPLKAYPAKIGSFSFDIDEVASAKDAASVLYPLSKKAQEAYIVLVLDKKNKPIVVLQHSVGGPISNQVFPAQLIGSILNTKNAHSVWFAHNHPSGRVGQSPEDTKLSQKIENILSGTGIKNNGQLILGPNGKGSALSTEGYLVEEFTLRKPVDSDKKLNVTERRLKGDELDRLDNIPIMSSTAMIAALDNYSNGQPGILLLHVDHTPAQFIPIPVGQMTSLKKGGNNSLVSEIIKTIEQKNSITAAGISINKDTVANRDAATNALTFLSEINIKVLDVVAGGKSLADTGDLAGIRANSTARAGTFFSTTPIPPSTRANTPAELRAKLGAGYDALIKSGKLRIVATQKEAQRIIDMMRGKVDPFYSEDGKTIQGFYHNGVIHLISDGIATGKAWSVLVHEAAHATSLNLKDKIKQIEQSVKKRINEDSATGRAIREADAAIPENTLPEHKDAERLAYLIENHPDTSIVRRIIALIKQALVKLGFKDVSVFTVADLRAMAEIAVRREARAAKMGTVRDSRMVGENQEVFGSFAGAKANSTGLDTAQKMEAQGKTPREIWNATGWWKLGKGETGSWKYEIDDSMSDIRTDKDGLLSEALRHPPLFKDYPQIEKIRVKFADLGDTKRGGYDAEKRIITINENFPTATQRSTLQHEVQHIIQGEEGFATGGSLKEQGPDKYWRQTGEVEARLVQARLDMPPAKRKLIPPWVTLRNMLRKEGLLKDGQTVDDVLMDSGKSAVMESNATDYEQYRELNASKTTNFKNRVRLAVRNTMTGIDKYLGATSTRLKNIHPKLEAKLRGLDFRTGTNLARDVKQVLPLLQKIKAMDKGDSIDFDLARKNGDTDKINEIVGKYKIEKEYAAYRDTLDRIRDEANNVGFDVGFLKEYAPRVIRDVPGFLAAVGKGDDWPIIEQRLKARAEKMGITVEQMDPTMKADIIANMILGQGGMGQPGNVKERTINQLTPELAMFYMDSDGALMHYLHNMRKHIEIRTFFGKIPTVIRDAKTAMRQAQARLRDAEKEKNTKRIDDITETIKEYQNILNRYKNERDYSEHIGTYILDLMNEGILNKQNSEQQKVLTDILKARFHETGTRGAVQLYKNLSYLDTMGSTISAVTQIGDLAWTLYENGWIGTAKAVAKAAIKKSRITKKDVGIERMAQEFADADTMSNAVAKVFKLVGLEKMDTIGKEAMLNASLEKFEKRAKNEPEKLKEEIADIFEKETDSVIADLQAGEITDNVKLLVYSKLLDYQPASLSEQPEKYLNAGNGRIFYMLKSYTLKQFDVFRREAYNKIKNGDSKQKLEGFRNLIYLSALIALANAGADEIKDLMLGRETSLEDRTVDNVLRLFGVSKYLTWQARTDGLGTAVAKQVLPPFKFINAVYKDTRTAGDDKGFDTVASIPIVGKLAYWHMGKGKDNTKSLAEQRFSDRLRKLNGIKDKVEREPTLATKYSQELAELRYLNKVQGRANKIKERVNKLKAAKASEEAISTLEGHRVKLLENSRQQAQGYR